MLSAVMPALISIRVNAALSTRTSAPAVKVPMVRTYKDRLETRIDYRLEARNAPTTNLVGSELDTFVTPTSEDTLATLEFGPLEAVIFGPD